MGKNTNRYAQLDALVARAAQGDKKAFERLCETDGPNIVFSCIKYMGNPQDGQDAAQEVFIRLQQKLPTLKTPQTYVVWVQKLIFSVCSNMRRKNMKHANDLTIDDFADLFTEQDAGVIPQEYLNNDERRRELSDIVNGLPAKTRSCITLHYFNDLTIPEIADVLDITENNVASHLYLGREKIRKALQDQNPGLYTQTRILLPMAALTEVFRQELQDTVTPALLSRCLQPVGVHLGGTPLAKGVLMGAAAALTATGILVSTLLFTSKPIAGTRRDVPQHSSGESLSAGYEDTAAASAAGQPVPPSPGTSQEVPGGETPAPQPGLSLPSTPVAQASGPHSAQSPPGQPSAAPATPPAQSKPLVPQQTLVTGAVVLNGVDPAAGLNLQGNEFYAVVEQGGTQLGLTPVDTAGRFTFEDLYLTESGTYTVRLLGTTNLGIAFAAQNPEGRVDISLVPGQAAALPGPIRLEDTQPPQLSLQLLDAQGNPEVLNPRRAEIEAYDATRISLAWHIRALSGETPAQGTGATLEATVFEALPPGEYSLHATATDSVGNTSQEALAFYID